MSNLESNPDRSETRRDFLGKIALLFSLPFVGEILSTAGEGSLALPPYDWIQRILADPDNLDLRREYGGWLLAQGNPLGKHICLECEIAPLDRTSPDYYRIDSRLAKLKYEGDDWEKCLASKWGDERRQKVNAPAPTASFDARMRLGMLEGLRINDVELFASHSEEILAEAPLVRCLRIERSSDSHALQRFLRSPVLARIRELEFYECALDESFLSAWAQGDGNRKLKKLSFDSCKLDAVGVRDLFAESCFPQLESLGFWWTEFLDGSNHCHNVPLLNSIFHAPACPNLKEIRVGRCPFLGSDAIRTLIGGPLPSHLERLDLGANKLRPADLKRLSSVRFPALRALRLTGGSSAGSGLSLNHMPRLESLSLIDMQLRDDSACQILRSAPPTMVELRLQGGLLSCPTGELISMLPNSSILRLLDLGDNRVDSRGARAIARSPYLTNLLALRLGWNQIDAEGTRQISASPNMQSLRFLHLGDNRLGPDGIKALASSPNLGSLDWLNIDENGLTEEVVLEILNSPNLPHLVALRADSFSSNGNTAQRFAERFGIFDFMASYGYYGRLI